MVLGRDDPELFILYQAYVGVLLGDHLILKLRIFEDLSLLYLISGDWFHKYMGVSLTTGVFSSAFALS